MKNDKEQPETVEQAANAWNENTDNWRIIDDEHAYNAFIAGANWQASQHSHTEQKWVSVEDRLPESEVVVFVWKPLPTPMEDLGNRTLAYYHHGLTDWYSGIKHIKGITFWQPMPSPPNSKTTTPPTYTQEQMIAFGESVLKEAAESLEVTNRYYENRDGIYNIDISKLLKTI